MRWWRRKRTRRGGAVPASQIIRQWRAEDAEDAVRQARRTLDEVRARRPVVEAEAAAQREIRQHNHFAELFTRAMGGEP